MVKEKFKTNKTFVRISAFITVLIIIALITVFINKNESYVKRLNEEYPMVVSSDSVSGVVKDFEKFKGQVNVTLQNNNKHWLKHAQNHNYPEETLSKLIQIGDSIYKPKGSDTLFIYRNSQEYYFVLGKVINDRKKLK